MKLKKIQLKIQNWNSNISLPITIDNCVGIKVRWLAYNTASEGNFTMEISSNSFPMSGYHLAANGSTFDYFYSAPLDQAVNVSCISSDLQTQVMDINLTAKKSINQFNLEFFINHLPATDITPQNPVSLELGFYSDE